MYSAYERYPTSFWIDFGSSSQRGIHGMLVACSSLSVPEPVCGQLLLDTCSEADLKIITYR